MIIELEDREIATLRVALAIFSEYLNEEGFGNDEGAKEIARLHQMNINSMRKKIINKQVA